ncbi:MAG: Y4bD/Y4pK family protein [Actinobacteria bacterium]|nr:Y4bD/Y4pK family protein [Actinomycetota bacterium]
MTHPFHPWCGRAFVFVALRQTWGEDRVFFLDEDGTLKSLPTAWTDAVGPDVFVAVAAGRSPLRAEDLVALAELVARARDDNGEDDL